jgi:hypothetical protein
MGFEVALSRSTMLEINPIYVFDGQNQPVAVHLPIASFSRLRRFLGKRAIALINLTCVMPFLERIELAGFLNSHFPLGKRQNLYVIMDMNMM